MRVSAGELLRPPPPLPAAEGRWALFLDVDGTLLEFAANPAAVRVPPGLSALLLRLQHRLHGALALVSGRRIAALDNLFRPLLLPAAGLHGFECRDGRGVIATAPLNADLVPALHKYGQQLAQRFPGVLVEDKQVSLAFHYDGRAAPRGALLDAVQTLAARLGFEVLAGRCVFEVKPAGVSKGRALAAFMEAAPFAGRTPVFIGDDVTDAGALRVAHERGGLAIQVAERIDSAAPFGLADPRAVQQWLLQWEEQLE